jgi:hypothetical protein
MCGRLRSPPDVGRSVLETDSALDAGFVSVGNVADDFFFPKEASQTLARRRVSVTHDRTHGFS